MRSFRVEKVKRAAGESSSAARRTLQLLARIFHNCLMQVGQLLIGLQPKRASAQGGRMRALGLGKWRTPDVDRLKVVEPKGCAEPSTLNLSESRNSPPSIAHSPPP